MGFSLLIAWEATLRQILPAVVSHLAGECSFPQRSQIVCHIFSSINALPCRRIRDCKRLTESEGDISFLCVQRFRGACGVETWATWERVTTLNGTFPGTMVDPPMALFVWSIWKADQCSYILQETFDWFSQNPSLYESRDRFCESTNKIIFHKVLSIAQFSDAVLQEPGLLEI